jgi:AbrB family looped-hinge helix DNA binding protein
MRRYDANVTVSGRVTIPAEVRRHLGVRSGDRITFIIETDRVTLVPAAASYTFEFAFGAVLAIPGPSVDFDKEIEEALEDAYDDRH